ncbi:hypothetical protein VCRA2123O443_40215 [Vibrio crassostreae]|uniref:hypothetical protein n=1 Tax=Vibrio crassostreae TaxID=246167 RepID=UPI000F48C4B8|nr:hypothetical protein [Vibrio crassostreae]ROR16009.1 hypothetical protein EDB36_104126 [Vibrio crassostreae]CAK2077062.1 hypothetical protein VCRA2110O182_40128 [Vibrio crassostreae]CAK2344529.1 hypothetical protein VCRA2111O408_40128 [Vibrio crassostreae]CAK2355220.1 hypothetical protein VCRA211O406_30213 [Vibrio crassostreae]CAK3410355.1 hypothetical protein VCRA2123O443_40215 [Vibrio crassostreae]
MLTTKDITEKDQFIIDIKKEFVTTFDKNITVNIEKKEVVALYHDITIGNLVPLSDIIRLIKLLD